MTHDSIKAQSREDEELEETISNFSLANLKLDQQANYSCAALNSLGVSNFVTIELMIAGLENKKKRSNANFQLHPCF